MYNNYVTYDCKCVALVLFKPISLQMLLTNRCILFCNERLQNKKCSTKLGERKRDRERLLTWNRLRVEWTNQKRTLPGNCHNVGSRRACSLCRPAVHRPLLVVCSLSHSTGSLQSGGLYPCVTGQTYQQSIKWAILKEL